MFRALPLLLVLVSAACRADGTTSQPAAAEPAPEPTEAGFTHCCGNEAFKLEIECGEMLKRCYRKVPGGWEQTFGRHCKEHLDQSCYLKTCEARCGL